jgi:hypothetical protein
MYASDVPTGYTEHWRKIISVYPPVDTQTMMSALGGGYPGSMPMIPTMREVRLNTEKGRIEIWERSDALASPRPGCDRGRVLLCAHRSTIYGFDSGRPVGSWSADRAERLDQLLA